MRTQILVAIDCLLCTGKSLQSKIASSKINDQLTVPTTKWPNANGEKCTGITDSVSYVQPGCMETRHCDTVTHIITSQFCSFGSGLFHKQNSHFPSLNEYLKLFAKTFRQLVKELSLNNLLLKPDSMTTSLFQAADSLDVAVLKGWASQRTAQVYVTSVQDIAAHSITSEAFKPSELEA